ncbi:MAG: hypothetical protein RR994_03865, partial [Clostridia bacterium]
ETCRNYTSMCYDTHDKCFWATGGSRGAFIYKLNKCFEEIDCIRVHATDICGSCITGVSYDCCNDTLMVSFDTGIVCVNKRNSNDTAIIKKDCRECIMSVTFTSPYYFCYCFAGKKKFIRIYSGCGELVSKCEVPREISIEAILFNPCTCDFSHCHFYILASKDNCYSYVYHCILDCEEVCAGIYQCNYNICKDDCSPGERGCNPKKACCDVLESIALVETALSHILNAEGEKLQKVIASTDDVCKMLEANDSVRRTIEKAAHLECILYDKMGALKEWCDDLDNDGCECRNC